MGAIEGILTAADKQLTLKNLHYQRGSKTAPLDPHIRLIHRKLGDALKNQGTDSGRGWCRDGQCELYKVARTGRMCPSDEMPKTDQKP